MSSGKSQNTSNVPLYFSAASMVETECHYILHRKTQG